MNEQEFLRNYDITKYERPSVTVDIMLLGLTDTETDNYRKVPHKRLCVLLIKRKGHPYKGKWAFPGGFVGMKESLDEAAYRELQEETGVKDVYLEQLYTYGVVDRDPRGRVISTTYLSLVDKTLIDAKADSDAEEAAWFDLEYKYIRQEREMLDNGYRDKNYYRIDLTRESEGLYAIVQVTRKVTGKFVSIDRQLVEGEGLAFDHGLILQQGIERLRNKLEYTDVIFPMMPDLFTLTELQRAYERILGTQLLKANFRRKTAKFVLETDRMTSDGGHRPSRLYRFNPDWDKE